MLQDNLILTTCTRRGTSFGSHLRRLETISNSALNGKFLSTWYGFLRM
ncbi:unnamed protein product [Tenebrio molitor]|nr:unnamed protein product [Tenebrio molitor]